MNVLEGTLGSGFFVRGCQGHSDSPIVVCQVDDCEGCKKPYPKMYATFWLFSIDAVIATAVCANGYHPPRRCADRLAAQMLSYLFPWTGFFSGWTDEKLTWYICGDIG